MPRPPLLPKIDWQKTFTEGMSFDTWLKQAESPETAKQMWNDYESFAITPEVAAWLENIPKTVNVICIAEDWCGDVARHVPVLEKLAATTKGKLQTRYILREYSPELFARYLTNGGEALPKFVFISSEWIECGNWGPMPSECRDWISRGKACNDVGAARKKVSALYKSDPKRDQVVEELLSLIDIAGTPAVS